MALLIIFQSTHHVLKAEKILLAAGVRFEIIPTPKNISSECGMSMRMEQDILSLEHFLSILRQNEIVFRVFKTEL